LSRKARRAVWGHGNLNRGRKKLKRRTQKPEAAPQKSEPLAAGGSENRHENLNRRRGRLKEGRKNLNRALFGSDYCGHGGDHRKKGRIWAISWQIGAKN